MCLTGVPLLGVLFANFAPDATTVMTLLMLALVASALWPARLVVGCDGFRTTWLGTSRYVPFVEVESLRRVLKGVTVARRGKRALRLFTFGITVDGRDYIVDLENRFCEWQQGPKRDNAYLAGPFRGPEPDPVAEALDARLSEKERAEAFGRIRVVPNLEDFAERGASFADPKVGAEIQRLKKRGG